MNYKPSFERRSPVKTISAWLGIAAGSVMLLAGFTKSYYQTPMKLEQHDAQIRDLQASATATARELREQRDLLLEIRGDLKALNREIRNN